MEKRLGCFGMPLAEARQFASGEVVMGVSRAVADIKFNLLRYGTFDRYDFFVPDAAEEQTGHDPRLRVVPESLLPTYVSKYLYTVFHHPNPTFQQALMKSRAASGLSPFPVTTTVHTASYASLIRETFAPYCYLPTRPEDAVFACSSAVKRTLAVFFEFIEGYGKDRGIKWLRGFRGDIPIIPFGIDADALGSMRVSSQEARKRLGLPENVCIILFLGRICASTKADLLPLVQAFGAIRTVAGVECSLLIAGGGNDASGQSGFSKRFLLMEDLISQSNLADCVKFLHRPSDEEKGLIYSAADIYVSLSDNIQESFGLTVLEAQAMGLPVVVSDWDGYRDLVVPGETGFLVPTYWMEDPGLDALAARSVVDIYHFRQAQAVAVDLNAFAKALLTLVKHPAQRRAMGERAARHAQSFSWRSVIAKYEAFWLDAHVRARNASGEKRGPVSMPGPEDIQMLDEMTLHYFEAFGHCATSIVSEAWRVGRGVVDQLTLDFAYGNLGSDLLMALLDAFESTNEKTVRIATLIDATRGASSVASIRNADRREVLRHIMWLAKQGTFNLKEC